MGSLVGHVAPGFGFLVIGLWHLYNHVKLLALKGGRHYRSLPWFPASIRHMELYIIIIGTSISVSMELFIGPQRHQPLDPDWTIPSNHLHNFEHSSISLTFLVYAIFAISLDGLGRPSPAQYDVLQFIGGVAFAQQLLLFHLHSTDHMGVEGQYHWLLQLVIFISLATTFLGIGYNSSFIISFVRSLSILFQGVWLMVMGFALWTPGFVAKGCFMHDEDGHYVVRCDGHMSLQRAKSLVNIQFSWFLILLSVFAAFFYVLMMRIYGGHNKGDYSPMSFTHLEAGKFTQTQGFLNNNNKPIHHMERSN